MRIFILIAFLIYVSGCTRSDSTTTSRVQDKVDKRPSPKSSQDLRTALQEIQIAYQQQARRINSQLEAAESSEQREQLMAKAAEEKDLIQEAIDLFAGHESDEAYIDMAIWVLRTADDQSSIDGVLRNVETYHLDNDKIVSFLQVAASNRAPTTTDFLSTLADKGDSPASMIARLIMMSMLNPESDQERAIQLLDSVANYHGEIVFDGIDYKSIAAGQLFSLTRLKVGAEAPDITGEDVDGVTFSLSDYRGKVVMLDFWGDW